jgi:hypothetical protein
LALVPDSLVILPGAAEGEFHGLTGWLSVRNTLIGIPVISVLFDVPRDDNGIGGEL